MAKFVVNSVSKKFKNYSGKTYPHLIHMGQIDTNEIANDVANRSGISNIDVKAVLNAVGEVMADRMAMGYSVRLDGIGSFAPKLGWREDAEPEYVDSTTKRNAQSVRISAINYRADKDLILRTDQHSNLHRISVENQSIQVNDIQERLKILNEYLEVHSFVKVKEYAQLIGIERTRAGKELRKFAEEGKLILKGRGSYIYYMKHDTKSRP